MELTDIRRSPIFDLDIASCDNYVDVIFKENNENKY